MCKRTLLFVLLCWTLLALPPRHSPPAQSAAAGNPAGPVAAGLQAAVQASAGNSVGTGQTNVLVDRVEMFPPDFPLGTEIRLRVFFRRTAGVLEYSRPPEFRAAGTLPPDIISMELASAADGLECLDLQLIAWSPGQNWLQIPEYQNLVFPPLSLQVQSVLEAGYQPDLLGQLEVRGFRYQLIALLASIALFLLLLLGLAIFLPGLRLAAAGRRRARRALRLLDRQLRQLEKNAGSDAAAWQGFCRYIGEFLQERLACPDYQRWRSNPVPEPQDQPPQSAESEARNETRQWPELPFLPALATVELERLPPGWLPSEVRHSLLQLLRRGESVCWAGRPDSSLPAAILELRNLVKVLETSLQTATQSGLTTARAERSS